MSFFWPRGRAAQAQRQPEKPLTFAQREVVLVPMPYLWAAATVSARSARLERLEAASAACENAASASSTAARAATITVRETRVRRRDNLSSGVSWRRANAQRATRG